MTSHAESEDRCPQIVINVVVVVVVGTPPPNTLRCSRWLSLVSDRRSVGTAGSTAPDLGDDRVDQALAASKQVCIVPPPPPTHTHTLEREGDTTKPVESSFRVDLFSSSSLSSFSPTRRASKQDLPASGIHRNESS